VVDGRLRSLLGRETLLPFTHKPFLTTTVLLLRTSSPDRHSITFKEAVTLLPLKCLLNVFSVKIPLLLLASMATVPL
jgi:hypothetical protein